MRLLFLLVSLFVAFPSSGQDSDVNMGLLVMAHGGSENWNSAIEEAVAPLRLNGPVSIAFGMANPNTLQKAADELLKQGATSIGVVRLFVSGDSFLPETEYAFGQRSEKPSGHFMHEPRILNLNIPVRLSKDGLLDALALGSIMSDRASKLSQIPASESVLIVGHGPGDDVENEHWLTKMNQFADSVRAAAPFHEVKVATLREDWTGKREIAEVELRKFVSSESTSGRTVIIIPFRLFGFGPYGEVFQDQDYRADSLGFLPDDRITTWIASQLKTMKTMEQPEVTTGN